MNYVKPYHLQVSYDNQNEKLIYKRLLKKGQGENFYGLQVAKYLMKDKEFNEKTLEIMKEFDNENKPSRYNFNLTLEECYFCKGTENLECHHINWQKDFNKDYIHNEKLQIKKNKLYNLVVLCQKCHDKVDRDEIKINGWVNTTDGLELDYQINRKKEKSLKFNADIIEKILNIKDKFDNPKNAKLYIKTTWNNKISKSTINNIWNDNYG